MPFAPSDAEPWMHAIGARRGRYEVTERLGRGGYGEVYGVRDPNGARWAMKVLRLAHVDDRRAAERALLEARVLRRIEHVNVVRFEEALLDPDGAVVLVTERLEGSSLRDVIARGDVPVERALRLGRQLADAAAAVHAAGAVHRDIKPENVFVTAGDDVKLFDFGLVKCAGLTLRTTRQLGSPRYIAPEQLSYARSSGAPLDPRWDVYAIGLVVFELLSGRHPFDFDAAAPKTAAEVIERHLAGGLPRLDAAVPGLPVALADVIARATAREPARRTPGAALLATELAAARSAFQDAYDEGAGFLTAELKRRGAEVASDEAPASEDARTLERARPAWESPPATERLAPNTGRFGTEKILPKLDHAALLAGRRTRGT